MNVTADLHDLTPPSMRDHPALSLDSYAASQALGRSLRASGSDGLVCPSLRHAGGLCVGLFYPDCASHPVQGRHLGYHWDGARLDLVREPGTGQVFRVVGSS